MSWTYLFCDCGVLSLVPLSSTLCKLELRSTSSIIQLQLFSRLHFPGWGCLLHTPSAIQLDGQI